MIDADTIVHPYASTRLFAWEDPMGCPKRHGAAGVEQNINYDDLCSKKALHVHYKGTLCMRGARRGPPADPARAAEHEPARAL